MHDHYIHLNTYCWPALINIIQLNVHVYIWTNWKIPSIIFTFQNSNGVKIYSLTSCHSNSNVHVFMWKIFPTEKWFCINMLCLCILKSYGVRIDQGKYFISVFNCNLKYKHRYTYQLYIYISLSIDIYHNTRKFQYYI